MAVSLHILGTSWRHHAVGFGMYASTGKKANEEITKIDERQI